MPQEVTVTPTRGNLGIPKELKSGRARAHMPVFTADPQMREAVKMASDVQQGTSAHLGSLSDDIT